MQATILLATLAILTVIGFYMGRSRAAASVSGNLHRLHSLPSYYGYYVAMWCGFPALIVFVLWMSMEPRIVEMLVVAALPADMRSLSDAELGLLVNDIRNLGTGNVISRDVDPHLRVATDHYMALGRIGFAGLAVISIALSLAGITFGRRFIAPELRARNAVERTVMVLLVISSTIAILTTIGIVLSLLFESLRFFQLVSPAEFLFGGV